MKVIKNVLEIKQERRKIEKELKQIEKSVRYIRKKLKWVLGIETLKPKGWFPKENKK